MYLFKVYWKPFGVVSTGRFFLVWLVGVWYNPYVVIPNPATERGCTIWIYWFLFWLLSWVVWHATTSSNGWMVATMTTSQKRKPPDCTPGAFALWPYGHWLLFAYWHYSICNHGWQYASRNISCCFPFTAANMHLVFCWKLFNVLFLDILFKTCLLHVWKIVTKDGERMVFPTFICKF